LSMLTSPTSSGQLPRPSIRRGSLVCLSQAAIALLCIAIGSSLSGGEAAPAPLETSAVTHLVIGEAISRTVAAGQAEVFSIGLSPGHLFRAGVVKGDLGISVVVYAPDASIVSQYESRRFEPMSISFITGLDGDYRLEVRSLEIGTSPRPINFIVESVRAATEWDRRFEEAATLFADANRSRNEWTEPRILDAIDRYVSAWTIWHALSRPGDAARASRAAGECNLILGRNDAALSFFDRARIESRTAGDAEGEAWAIVDAARTHTYTANGQRAIATAESARALLERATTIEPDARSLIEAESLRIMGEGHYSQGDILEAQKLYARALELSTTVGDRAGQATVNLYRGYAHADAGEIQDAAEDHAQALTLYRVVGDRRGEALALTAIGGVHTFFNESKDALECHKQAREIFKTIGDHTGEAIVLNQLGYSYEELNEPELALENYTAALERYREARIRDAEMVSLYYLGRLCRGMGKLEEAVAYCDSSMKLSSDLGDVRMRAYALMEIATAQNALGRLPQALESYQHVMRIFTATGDRRGRAIALSRVGDAYYGAGNKQGALDHYEAALSLNEAGRDRTAEIVAHYNIARSARDLGQLDKALSHIAASIKLTEVARSQIAGQGLRTSYFAAASKYYETYIDMLMRADNERPGEGYAKRALQVSESARARALLDVLMQSGTELREGIDPNLLERERHVEELLRGKSEYLIRLLSDERASPAAVEVEAEVRRLALEHDEIEAQIRAQSPRYAAISQPQLLDLEGIQRELRDNMLLLEYQLGSEKSYLWAVTDHSFDVYALPGRATIEATARDVRTLLTARHSNTDASYEERKGDFADADERYAERAAALSSLLLGRVAERLRRTKLLIVPDGLLQYIPFEALPVPVPAGVGQESAAIEGYIPLVEQNEVNTLPSASTLALIRRETATRTRAAKTVFVFADPVFENDDSRVKSHDKSGSRAPISGRPQPESRRFSRLQFSRVEAAKIISTVPRGQGTQALDFEACRSTAIGDRPSQYQIVHFATHAVVNDERPELSGIVLSMVDERGEHNEGYLQLHDVYNLRIPAELVVLSACESGLGKNVQGEGLVGLTRGCFYAGARSVVASLWTVDDAATSELMGNFYRGMLVNGMSPSEALREAKLTMRRQKRWSAPYYWAGFVFQGDPQTTIVVGPGEWGLWSYIAAFALVVLLVMGVLGTKQILRRRRDP
jgi:CHAT domain-containing protein/tetratricopeptide (TPR) repeat protein